MTKKLLTICTALLLAVSVLPYGVNAQEPEQNEEMTEEVITEPVSEETENVQEEEAVPEQTALIQQAEAEEADPSALSSEGNAYAILTKEGELIFFRSTKTYTNKANVTAEDIMGSRYSGKVFTGVETFDAGNSWDGQAKVPWYSDSMSIRSVRVADGQIIKPVSMSHWFNGYKNLESFDASGFDTSNVKDMSYMFKAYEETVGFTSKLTGLDLSSFDTSAVTDMKYMFQCQEKLKELNLSGFDTSNVTDMKQMFEGCNMLEYVDVSSFDTSKVTDVSYMFFACHALKELDLNGFDLSSAKSAQSMFAGCSSLKSLDLTHLNSGNVTNMSAMFSGCAGLSALDLSGLDTSSAIDLSNLFAGCTGLTSLDLSPLNTSCCQDMSGMFRYCTGLKTIDLSPLETAIVVDMSEMFAWSGFTDLDLSVLDTTCNHSMWYMFAGCRDLKTLNLKGMKTSAVTDMTYAFHNCRSLKTLDLSSFDTRNVRSMSCMFWNCRSLESVNVSSFNTSNVQYMHFMFHTCPKLKSLDLSSFNTSNTEYMYRLVYDCAALETLDLSNFDTSDVQEMDNMFTGAYSLKTIRLGPKFTKWTGEYDVYLPAGKWTNSKIGKTLTETELTKQYPANAKNWAGTWQRTEVKRIPVTGIEVNADDEWLFPQNTMGMITASVLPENATNRRIMWSSSDPETVEVKVIEDEDFNCYSVELHAHKAGRALITARSEDGGHKTSFTVTVGFRDVTDTKSYYYEPVYWAFSNEITVGAGGEGKFSPNASCTREQIVTFLWRLMGQPYPETESHFSDVDEDAWYYEPVTWAAENGITTGLNDGTGRFGVGQPCTREQCVTFLWRAAGKPEVGVHQEFTDVTAERYFYDAISWAAENGITVGLNDGTGRFGVGQKCSRAMIVTFLYRFATEKKKADL